MNCRECQMYAPDESVRGFVGTCKLTSAPVYSSCYCSAFVAKADRKREVENG